MSKKSQSDGGRVENSEPQIGVDPENVDEAPDAAVASHTGFDVGAVDPEANHQDLAALVGQLDNRDVDPIVATLLEELVDENRRLREENEERRETIEDQKQTIKDLTRMVNGVRDDVDDLEEEEEETREIARSAIAKAEQADADPDQQEDAEELPTGVEPSTSPLDFFANCRQKKIKEMFVEESNRSNTYRAVAVAKRWREFAHGRTDGSGIFWTRDDLEKALTAQLGEAPHRMTVSRVWEVFQDLGGDDIEEKVRQVGRSQQPKDILSINMETAERLNESRYIGMDLLDGSESKAQTGGVTPVVTRGT